MEFGGGASRVFPPLPQELLLLFAGIKCFNVCTRMMHYTSESVILLGSSNSTESMSIEVKGLLSLAMHENHHLGTSSIATTDNFTHS